MANDCAEIVKKLRAVAEERGSCTAAATKKDLDDLVNALDGVAKPAVPASVAAFWKESAEWHFSRDHYNVFGFNIVPPDKIVEVTASIFGDEELKADWLLDRKGDACSVAAPGWLCFAATSEYDYLFVCFDEESPHFGHVRHMVNNCNTEDHVCNDAVYLAQRLFDWSSASLENNGGDESDNEQDDALSSCWRS